MTLSYYYYAKLSLPIANHEYRRRSTTAAASQHLVLSRARPPSLAATLRPCALRLCCLHLALQQSSARAVEATEK